MAADDSGDSSDPNRAKRTPQDKNLTGSGAAHGDDGSNVAGPASARGIAGDAPPTRENAADAGSAALPLDPAAGRALLPMSPAPRDVAIRGESIRLGQLLKLAGVAGTGGDARELVQDGAVRVNGEPETRRGRQLRDGDIVEAAGERLRVIV